MANKDVKRLIDKIKNLPPEIIQEVECFLDEHLLMEEFEVPKGKTETTIENILKKLQKDSKSQLNSGRLRKYIQSDWDIIKEKQLLTKFLVNCIGEYEKPDSEFSLQKRINRDSSGGTYLEDVFGQICTWYFSSHKGLWSKSGNFKIDIKINGYIPIPGNLRQKKPDIKISDVKSGKPICIIELKKSFTKSSLKREFNLEYNEYKKLGGRILYLFVIFNSSKTKTKTYKQIRNCKVICNDYNKLKNKVPLKIVDPLENILEEVYNKVKTILN